VTVAFLLGSAAVVLTVVRSWPQFVHLLRIPAATGVSTATWALAVACALAWASWGVRYEEPANIVANVLTGAGAAAVLGRLWRERGGAVLGWSAMAVGAVAAVVVTDAHLPGVLAAAAVTLGSVMFLPQVLEAWRTSDVGGISITAWVLTFGSAAAWLGYAVSIGDVVVGLPCMVILPAAASVIARCTVRRPQPVA
jgi:uncharacterized protein with PQ loop repeat